MTALTHMAAARPPGIADARVPCPLCGGLIHPVAGRCKHCKEDLTSFRSDRPQAAAALPALNGRPQNGSNGHAVAIAAPVPTIIPARNDASQPILPPRTTARSVPVARPHSVWRSWPMLVIILAGIAIITATVIMVMPQDHKRESGKMSAPPAPERMETNPLPDKQSQLDPPDPSDPWDQGGGVVPRAPNPVQPVPTPTPTPADPDPDDDDLWKSPGGTFGGTATGADFMIVALDHACTKLKSCPDADQSTLTAVCDAVSMMPKQRAPSCAAAQKCLDTIDHMSCATAAQASPHSLLSTINDCTAAWTQC